MRLVVLLAILVAACTAPSGPGDRRDNSAYGRSEPKPDGDGN